MTLQERLDAAIMAYHSLMTGTSPRVVVDQNGERVEFTPANASRLAQYIADLQIQITGSSSQVSGPAKVYF